MDHDQLGVYRLHTRLAHGAMGEVWEAECTEVRAGLKPGDRVAVKLVPEFLLHDTMLVERLKREAEAISRLEHPGIVAFHELGEDDGRVYMVLELLRGETLAQRLEKEKQLPIAEIERIGGAITGALAFIHGKGIYHRDLKPQNIFITEDGGVKLIDLGVAKVLDEASLTMTGSHFGTPAYMSPESFRDSKTVTGAADVWSLGVILYEMATGQLPFPGNSAAAIIAKISDTKIIPRSPAHLRPDLPDELARVIGNSLARDARGRPLAGAAARALGMAGGQKPYEVRRSWRRRLVLPGIALAAVLVGLFIMLHQRSVSIEAKRNDAPRTNGATGADNHPSASGDVLVIAPEQWKQHAGQRVQLTAVFSKLTVYPTGNHWFHLAPDIKVWATAPEFVDIDWNGFIGKRVTVTGTVSRDPQYGSELRVERPEDIQLTP